MRVLLHAFMTACRCIPRSGRCQRCCVFLIIVCLSLVASRAQSQALTVFAAASLTDALTDVSVKWVADGHPPVRLVFGSSSTLAHQIEQGAPANLFASADEKWMDYLSARKLIVPETQKVLLGNDLILIMPADKVRRVRIDAKLDLMRLVGPNGRIATGNPAHVPVGLYAKEALTTLGLWDQVAPHLAQADNVRGALAMVERGEASAGIVYGTDAAASKAIATAGIFPDNTHEPIIYPFAVVKAGDTPQARALMTYLRSAAALARFAARGFRVE
jgi:molybdate transport system substrate-binding protein